MVTVLLRGGLGNQMFQYATGMGVAKRNATELRLDTIFLKERLPIRNRTYRDYCLDIFSHSSEVSLTGLSKIRHIMPIPGLWLCLDFLGIQLRKILGIQKLIRQRDLGFDPAVLEYRGDLILFGYWMSEKFFADVELELRQAFRFAHPLEGEAKEIGKHIKMSNSVSLHVRRGDYVSLKEVKSSMGETDLSYYERALSYVKEQSDRKEEETPTVFVFSDDIEWCRQALRLPFPTVYVAPSSEGPRASYHLQLMSMCRNNIIANSTFSWWGAWLNDNPQKIVVAPKRWFAKEVNEDIVPARWTRL
jgi:hypothetical protein